MPHLTFGVLGELAVAADGEQLQIPAGRRRAVLTRLLVHPGEPVSADALVEAAWGSDVPADPRAALHTVLSRLRASLGADAIEALPVGYRLAAGAVDAAEFEELADRARAAEPLEARTLLEQALQLWRGPAYGEYGEATFAVAESARLYGRRLDAVELLASACLDCAEPGMAIPPLEGLLAEEPFREHAVELLALALYRAGRQAEALDRLRECRRVLADELGLDPAPALVEVEQRMLGHDLPVPPHAQSAPPSWLDTSTPFIGREDELAALVASVEENRLTVVTGPGGVGKSRTAAESVPILHDRLGLRVAVVELAGVVPGGFPAAVLDALGLRPDSGCVIDSLVDYLDTVPHLLVLDNCEHLLDEISPAATTLARRCRGTRVLATSRHRLGVSTERIVPLAPFHVSGQTTEATRHLSPAVRLLTDRIRRLQPAFSVTAANVGQLSELCRRLDGLPLALELAASRAATLGVGEMLATEALGLDGDDGDRLGAVVDWSHRLLDGDQQGLLAALSVFPGDFTVDSAHGLARRLPWWHGDPHAALGELVEASLVACHAEAGGVGCRLLAIVRGFAAARLAESGRAEETRLAHASYVRDLVDGIAADWTRCDGAEVGARLLGSAGDVVGALRWALDSDRVELASGIADAVTRCVHWSPGLELSTLLAEVGERCVRAADPHLAAGAAAGALFAAERGELEASDRLARAALAMSEETHPVTALIALGVVSMYAGDHDASARCFERLTHVPDFCGEGHTSLALLCCYADDLDTAREHAEIALAAGVNTSDASRSFARYAAGEVEVRTDPARGAALLAEAALEADRVGAEQVSRVARVALFAVLVRTGRHDEAVALGQRLLHDLRRWAAWTQVWTTLRLLAELLAGVGRAPDAAFFLAAVGSARAAPPPVGQDVARYADLTDRLTEALGEHVLAQIGTVAANTSRPQLLRRAELVLTSW